MTKKKENPLVPFKSRVVFVSESDNKLLKQHFLNKENAGCTKTRQQIVDDIFSLGLHTDMKTL
jgi:hypothetical protein